MDVGEGTVLLNTIHHNKSKYSEREYTSRDLMARKLQYKIALPIHRHLVKIVEDKVQMLNCTLNRYDARGAEDVWVGNLGCLKGNTPRKKMPHIRGGGFPLPITIIERYKIVTMA